MNSRERFVNSLTGGSIDRFFRHEHGAWPSTVRRWKTEGLPDFVTEKKASYEDVVSASDGLDSKLVTFQQYLGHDKLLRLPLHSGYTNSPLFPGFTQQLISEQDGKRTILDVDGIKKQIFTTDPDLSMPMFLEFPIKQPSDWATFKSEHMRVDKVAEYLGDPAAVARAVGESSRDFPVYLTACGGFGFPRNLMGDEGLCYAYYDYPDMIHDIMRTWCDINKEILRLVCRHITVDEYLIWEDMAYKNGPLISPDMFERFISPYYCELTACAKEQGVRAVAVDTDGDCVKLIPLFVEAGADALLPFEVQAGMDVTAIRRQFGDCFGIVGGIDKRALACDRDAIRREVDRVLPFFRDSLRYIPTLDHTVPVNVSYDNYRYYLDCVRSYE